MAKVELKEVSTETIVPKLALDIPVVPETPKKINHAYNRDKDRRMVKGIFRFHEVPNGLLEFTLLLHAGDQVKNYKMRDGEMQEVPLGVARHLNQNLWYPVHGFAQEENGTPSVKITQKIRRCSFQSLEFMDLDEIAPVGKPA